MCVIRKRAGRIIFLTIFMLGISAAVALTLYALRQNINLFYTPSELLLAAPKQRVRLGGMVAQNSVQYLEGLRLTFTVTDFKNSVYVDFTGIPPDLFKEGQGLVALGKFDGQIFVAEQILAKHDENYMP